MPTLLTIHEYAKHRKAAGLSGGSYPAVLKAIKSGRIMLLDGGIDPDVADIQWEKNTRHRIDFHGKPNQPVLPVAVGWKSAAAPDWAESKSRTEAAVAEIKEMQAAKMRCELIDREGYERAAYQCGRQIQKALVDVMPSRIAVDLAARTDPWDVECYLREQMRAELRALSSASLVIEDDSH
jgi:hypothetical protein